MNRWGFYFGETEAFGSEGQRDGAFHFWYGFWKENERESAKLATVQNQLIVVVSPFRELLSLSESF